MSGGTATAVSAQTTGAVQAGTALSAATVAATTTATAPIVNATTTLNAADLNVTGTATLTGTTGALIFDAANDVVHMPAGLTHAKTTYSTDAAWAPTPAELLALGGVQIITTAHRTITLPAAAAIVAALPQLAVGSCFTFAVANASAGAFNIVFAVAAGGTIPAAMPLTTVTPGNAGSVLVRMTNVTPAAEAYDAVIFGNA